MPDRPERGGVTKAELDALVASVSDALVGLASGRFDARVSRSGRGDPADVLAFLVNATIEEVEVLVRNLEDEREELRRARDQLLLHERLASIGEVAASIAHELIQPIAAIRLITDKMESRPEATIRSVAKEVERISDATERMTRIVDGMRVYARSSSCELAPMRAERPLLDAIEAVSDTLAAKSVVIETTVEDGLPTVLADASRLEQVFVNLLVNAGHALESKRLGDSRTIWAEVTKSDDRIAYRIEDDGGGIDAVHVPRIFDPFYTTKPVGVGTGLGLSISHGIIREHEGTIRYEPGELGARFVIELPSIPRWNASLNR